jgi:hypothetical protein
MKFLIKNYNKDENGEKELVATVLFEVKTIKEAQEKMAELIAKLKNNWQTILFKNNKTLKVESTMIINLYNIFEGMDIENYRNEKYGEVMGIFDFHTANVTNPTEKPIIAFLSDLMLKQESEADCMAEINWCFDCTDEASPKIVFEKSKCGISGMYFQDQEEDWDEETFGMKTPFDTATYNIWDIPVNKFEKYVKKIPESWLDDSIGIVFSARNY